MFPWLRRLALLMTLLAPLAVAEKPEREPSGQAARVAQGHAERERHDNDISVNLSVSLLPPLQSRDRERIREYIRNQGVPGDPRYPGGGKKSLPPGLQKKLERGGALPPGWQRKVARGEVLSPELIRLGHPLPVDFHRRLDGYSEGVELLVLEDRVLRLVEGRGTVLDVIDIADIMLR